MIGIDPYLLVYAAIFVGALLAFEGLRQTVSPGEAGEAKSRRMRMIAKGASRAEVLQLLRPARKRGIIERLPLVSSLPANMQRAGMTMKPQTLIGFCLLGMVAIFVVGSQVAPPLVALAMAAVCAVAPVPIVNAKAKKRMDKLVAQLPDALDLMARGLRVGHPLNTTIGSVASEMPDPIASEFGILVDQVSYGEDIVSAFRDLADRVDLEDVRYLAGAIAIQHGSGGNLARILNVLSKVIRDRATMRRKVKAISSEGRISAYILTAIPPGIFLFSSATAPEYYGGVMDKPLFMPIAIVVVCLVVANGVVLRKLVNFRY